MDFFRHLLHCFLPQTSVKRVFCLFWKFKIIVIWHVNNQKGHFFYLHLSILRLPCIFCCCAYFSGFTSLIFDLHSFLHLFFYEISTDLEKLWTRQRKRVKDLIVTSFSGCLSLGFSTAFSIRPPSKFPARGWVAPSFCFSQCCSSFSSASSVRGGRCRNCLVCQCFSSTFASSSRPSPSSTAGSSVNSSCSREEQSNKFMLKKTIQEVTR